jgi:hypothetical protein
MTEPNPFQVLEVKRSYFAQLQKHPPHTDPEGFRRLRAAYETLIAARGLASAFVDAPCATGVWVGRAATQGQMTGEDANRMNRRIPIVFWHRTVGGGRA